MNKRCCFGVEYLSIVYGPFPDAPTAHFWALRAADRGLIGEEWGIVRLVSAPELV